MSRTNHRASDLHRNIKHFIAMAAVGAGTVRGQRAGVQPAIREYLNKHVDLRRVPKKRGEFRQWLNRRTRGVLCALKGKARERPWGLARKVVNLFLRDCLYNHYLRHKYRLARMETWLEVPLDSVVARELRKLAKETGWGPLPMWPGLKGRKDRKGLTPEVNARFQDFASWYARKKVGVSARVFLDNYLWPLNR